MLSYGHNLLTKKGNKMSGLTSRVIVNGNPGSFLDLEVGDSVRHGDPEFKDGRYIGRPLIVTKPTGEELDNRSKQIESKDNLFRRIIREIFG